MTFEDIYRGYVLVDSSALIALIDGADQQHPYATLALSDLKNDPNVRLFICNLTIYETYTHLRYKFNWECAEEVWSVVLTSIQPHQIEFRTSDEAKTRELLQTYRFHELSFHDAGCATVMLDNKIGRVFSFDSDFSTIGFERFPDF